ncbi:MAG: methyltransferase [Candidatus Sulfotelmatobacter sp.]
MTILTAEQQRALVQWKKLLAEAGLERVLVRDAGSEPAQTPERLQPLVRLFGEGQSVVKSEFDACVPEEVRATVEELGLVPRVEDTGLVPPFEDRVAARYRLVFHLGLWLFCEWKSPTAKFYYGNDSLLLSRTLDGAVAGNALDLCSGVGTQALVCARTATRVTAVEIEPLAAKLFWVNAAMNGLSDKLELINGNLLDPVAGRKFDVISCNPPFMPVPPGVRYPRFGDGGGDGLDIVRRLMAGLPDTLAPGGRCEVIAAVLGNRERPDLAPFQKMAADSRLAIIVDCCTRDELEGETMKRLVALSTMEGAGGKDVFDSRKIEEAYRRHFASLGATHLYCYVLHATQSPCPMMCASYRDDASNSVWMTPVG